MKIQAKQGPVIAFFDEIDKIISDGGPSHLIRQFGTTLGNAFRGTPYEEAGIFGKIDEEFFSNSTASDTNGSRTLQTLLQGTSSALDHHNIIYLFTTNYPLLLPKTVLNRTTKMYVPLPSASTRKAFSTKAGYPSDSEEQSLLTQKGLPTFQNLTSEQEYLTPEMLKAKPFIGRLPITYRVLADIVDIWKQSNFRYVE